MGGYKGKDFLQGGREELHGYRGLRGGIGYREMGGGVDYKGKDCWDCGVKGRDRLQGNGGRGGLQGEGLPFSCIIHPSPVPNPSPCTCNIPPPYNPPLHLPLQSTPPPGLGKGGLQVRVWYRGKVLIAGGDRGLITRRG